MESGKLDWQPLINIGATAVLGVVGWFVKGIRDDVRAATVSLADFKLEVAKEYVTHADLSDIKNLLIRIEEKLDRKQDK